MVEICVFEIVGVSPLLMNNPAMMEKIVEPADESADETESGDEKKDDEGGVTGIKIYVPAEEAEIRTYRQPDGQLFAPSVWFRGALIKGSSYLKVGKFSAPGRVSAAVATAEPECPLVHPETGEALSTYEVLSVRAKVGRAGIIRSRPMIRAWGCLLALEIDVELADVVTILRLLKNAGRVAGVGDWRPNTKGSYGKFSAKLHGA